MPGPNDFHYESDPTTGALVMLPGLGADEPDEITMASLRADAEANRATREALERAQAKMAEEASALEAMEADMLAREQALAEREARLAQLEASASTAAPVSESRRSTARQATERASS